MVGEQLAWRLHWGVGAILLCFYFILALSWLQTHHSSHLLITQQAVDRKARGLNLSSGSVHVGTIYRYM